MKFISVNKNNSSGNAFELWYNDKKLMGLSLSKQTRTARIDSGDDKRAFFIEKKRFQQNKTVIKNEYGVKMGELNTEQPDANTGTIELDGKKYGYSLNENNSVALTLSNEAEKPFLSCNLSAVIDTATSLVKKSISLHDTKYPYILTALCWYLLKFDHLDLK